MLPALPPLDFPTAAKIDVAIERAIAHGICPGAVVVIGHQGKIVFRKSYGERAVVPSAERMTVDTVFDIASLTKVVATTPCLMKLYEQGKFRLDDKLTRYIPEFQNGKIDVTIRQLLTHTSGLRPDVPLKPPWHGYEKGIQLACTDPPAAKPGEQFEYSDINFILLGELVHRLSGKSLDVFAEEEVFKPLGMSSTSFLIHAKTQRTAKNIAPTEQLTPDEPPLRGVVHDPTARNMGGVAGHAGVFSTADDLAKYAQMMLNEGRLGRKRLFKPETVRLFTAPETLPDHQIRGLGWDIQSDYSTCRGKLFPLGSYGHTGFTGTSIWIDPKSQSFVILLTNSIHPHMRPPLNPLRAEVATLAAEGLLRR